MDEPAVDGGLLRLTVVQFSPGPQCGAMAVDWVLAVIVDSAGVWLVLVHTGITSCPNSLTGVITRVACPS